MYAARRRHRPRPPFELARATYAEMALAGITAVGEFHYLHHRPDGRPYADHRRHGRVAGRGCGRGGSPTHPARHLLPPAGLQGWVTPHRSPGPVQRRGRRAVGGPGGGLGGPGRKRLAPRGGRPQRPGGRRTVDGRRGRLGPGRGLPCTCTYREQPAENEDALAVTGRTPTGLAEAAGCSGPTPPRSTPPT